MLRLYSGHDASATVVKLRGASAHGVFLDLDGSYVSQAGLEAMRT